MIYGIYFSPTGGTRAVALQACEALAERLHTDYCLHSYTTPADREQCPPIPKDALVVWGTPVYAGRVPNKTLPFVEQMLRGEDNPLVAIATFGGRAYDDALAEMAQIARRSNLRMVAAAAMATRHVFSATLGAGRPSPTDIESLTAFCRECNLTERIALPGEEKELTYYTPLRQDSKPARFLKAAPQLDSAQCTHCGGCVLRCPLGSITMEQGTPSITGTCIKCMACVEHCPHHAFTFTDEDFLSHIRMIEQHFTTPAPNWFSES
ncbi:MAG: 4Fe-4S binding protein [Bacteroidales bacterium]|nr:4Fe-4S binding protein [Bacteroidales bacterium]MCF0211821.1 4Fe-4S binding protein [Bacteroidales bacterium]MCF0212498.1 4Fe-4S binding protein [Bacteroidales bacterium]MCF0212647.1 4Fe-4S binding protein [Bacteroidales bacterium]